MDGNLFIPIIMFILKNLNISSFVVFLNGFRNYSQYKLVCCVRISISEFENKQRKIFDGELTFCESWGLHSSEKCVSSYFLFFLSQIPSNSSILWRNGLSSLLSNEAESELILLYWLSLDSKAWSIVLLSSLSSNSRSLISILSSDSYSSASLSLLLCISTNSMENLNFFFLK